MPGQTVTFTTTKSFGRTAVQCTAITNGAGVATCLGHNALSLSGKWVYTATFAGTGNYDLATASGRLTS